MLRRQGFDIRIVFIIRAFTQKVGFQSIKHRAFTVGGAYPGTGGQELVVEADIFEFVFIAFIQAAAPVIVCQVIDRVDYFKISPKRGGVCD